jgi:hypothetical protein
MMKWDRLGNGFFSSATELRSTGSEFALVYYSHFLSSHPPLLLLSRSLLIKTPPHYHPNRYENIPKWNDMDESTVEGRTKRGLFLFFFF